MTSQRSGRLARWLGIKSQSHEIVTRSQDEIAQLVEDRAQTVLAEAQALCLETSFGLLSRLEQRVQDAEAAAKAFVEERIAEYEEGWEARTHNAEARAISYAEHRLDVITSGLRALGKAIAQASSSGGHLGREQTSLQVSLGECREQVDRLSRLMDANIPRENNASNRSLSKSRNAEAADYITKPRNIDQRLDLARDDILHEVQAAALKANDGQSVDASYYTTRIVDAAKLMSMRVKGLKLNVGCGKTPLDGYVNVDRRDLPGVDIIAEATSLPIKHGEVKEIISSHLVEHFSARELEKDVLPHWHDLLEPGGELVTVAPDGAAMLDGLKSGNISLDDFRNILFASKEYEGDHHLNLLSPATMTESLKKAGFVAIETVYEGRRNGTCVEFRISGRKLGRE